MKRFQALDAIRGIAIILVLIWHYLPRDGATPGFILSSTRLFWSGVDLFFVLSGFLIGGILLHYADSKNYFSTFYIRRAARILPLYILFFAGFILLLRYAPEFVDKSYKRHLPLWSYFTFTQNFLYASRQLLNDPFVDVTWSLAVEEQFYIFLSLLVRNFSKKKLSWITIALIAMAVILRFYAPNFLVAYLLPFHRADSLMLGVLLALIWQWDRGKEFLYQHVSAFRWSFVLLFLVIVYLTQQEAWMGDVFAHFWLALFYCNLIVLALILDGSSGRFNLFKSRVLEWFGLRSYGIYLLHKPIQIMLPVFLAWFLSDTPSAWTLVILSLVILFVIAELSYRLLESPLMRWGHRFKYNPIDNHQAEAVQPRLA